MSYTICIDMNFLKKIILFIKTPIKNVYQRIIYYSVSYDYGYIHTNEQVNDLYLRINKNKKYPKQAYSKEKKDKFIFIGDKNLHSVMRIAVFGDVINKNSENDCVFFTTRQLKNKKFNQIHDAYFRLNKKISLPFKSFFEKKYTTSVINKYSDYNVFFIFLAGAYFEETFSQPYLWKQIRGLSKKTYVHKLLYLVDPVDKFFKIKYWFPFFDMISGCAIEDVDKYGLTYINAPCVIFRDLKQSDKSITSDIYIRAQGREKTITGIYNRLSSLGVKCDFHIQVKEPSDYDNKDGLNYTNSRIPYYEMVKEELQSNVLLEVVVPNVGSGATLRYKEAIIYNKKLLTNNPTYKLLPYTDSKNIMYFENIDDIDAEWIKKKEDVEYGYKDDFLLDIFLKKVKEVSLEN